MMGQEEPSQNKLFYTDFSLEQRVRQDHPLRKIAAAIDFDFSYGVVAEHYGKNGNVSVPPPVILKLLLLLTLYNVRSERELMDTIPERLDWVWFLGFDLDSSIPNHSVLSKARARWGAEVFKDFFERVVWQCVEAGLVDGSKIFMDSSFIDANASKASVVDTQSLKRFSNKRYLELEARLELDKETKEENTDNQPRPPKLEVNQRYISTTDPDASIVRKGGSKSTLCFQTHRAVDSSHEIITATEVTRGHVNEATRLVPLLEQHSSNTRKNADTVVADSKYGTIKNYIACHERGVKAHIPDLKKANAKQRKRKKLFLDTEFHYEPETDTYRCPTGNSLKPGALQVNRQSRDYAAKKTDCQTCILMPQCTRSKTGRTIKRHLNQPELNLMRERSRSAQAKRDIRTRQHLMERSFARGTRFSFDRARWRGSSKVAIQEYLVCSIQNIEVLMRHRRRLPKSKMAALRPLEYTITKVIGKISAKTRNYLRQNDMFKYCRNFIVKNRTESIGQLVMS